MKKIILLSFMLLPYAGASELLDQKLQYYITEFQLAPLKAPPARNDKLFTLGRNLFMDTRLSGNDNISCLDCHHPRLGTGDALPLAIGEGAVGFQVGERKRMQGTGHVLARNAPSVMNLHGLNVMFWDGRIEYFPRTRKFLTPVPLKNEISRVLNSALAAQAIFPIVDHDEMRGQKGSNPIADARDEHEAWELVVEKIVSIEGYKKLFAEVFPGEKINIGHFGKALAEFQSHAFYIAQTPFDGYLLGQLNAMNEKQKQGMDVFFGKGKCGECHNGEYLTNLDYESVGAPQIGPGKQAGDDLGRYQWDPREENRYAFRVPPLRNVALTAPYFHNGSMNTLEEVVEHYIDVKKSLELFRMVNQWDNYHVPLKPHDAGTNYVRLQSLPDELPLTLELTSEEKSALVEFLKTGLTDIRLF